ncbi:MAG: pilus assembly protein PilP [Deltaproteobacteria bacterium]|nr:pilus assembly protein PilP [Deltaproteobacteria bacterium]
MKRQLSVISCQLESAMSKSSNEVKGRYFFYSLLIAFLCSLFTVLTGCQQAPPPPQAPVASQAKKEAPKPAASLPAAEVKEGKKEDAATDVKQKNPFKPFITKLTEKAAVVPKTPLQKYELEQLKLVAVMWGMNGSFAMVEAPDGKGFSIKKGDLIGSRDGRVKRIEKDRVVVEERFTEAGGEVTTSEFEIKLPLPKGEEELK